MEFSRQEFWSRWPFPSPGDLPNPGITLQSLASPTLAGRFFTSSPTWETRELAYDPAIPLLDTYSEKAIIPKDTCTQCSL